MLMQADRRWDFESQYPSRSVGIYFEMVGFREGVKQFSLLEYDVAGIGNIESRSRKTAIKRMAV